MRSTQASFSARPPDDYPIGVFLIFFEDLVRMDWQKDYQDRIHGFSGGPKSFN